MKKIQKYSKFCFDLHPRKAKLFSETCMAGLSLEVKFISVQKNMFKLLFMYMRKSRELLWGFFSLFS